MRPVNANPTKKFFVSSLTRDIALDDAILDLLDNCIDGIMRTLERDQLAGETPYSGFEAKITATPEEFTIVDNCGGIPLETALNQAFRFGRVDEDIDEDIPTVGMYGIGMKRAIFKMGRTALVESHHEDDSYFVEIPEEWLTSDEWNLELEDTPKSDEQGTIITVSKLYPSVQKEFSSTSNFLTDLAEVIGQNFAFIIEKGFRVILNDEVITPAPLTLFTSQDYESQSITPYVYKGQYEDVSIYAAIGFYRELSKISTLEDSENDLIERNRNNAGITVICNDRVVLYKDKSRKTGWGVGQVPSFHNQFINITGVVEFTSNKSLSLPLTTTKRGVDLGADVYSFAIEYVKKGIKKFTDFTNHWKGREEEVKESFSNLKQVHSLRELKIEIIPNLRKVNRSDSEFQYNPTLPRPEREVDTVRIAYRKKHNEVNTLKDFFFPDNDISYNDIGEWCFDEILKKIKQ